MSFNLYENMIDGINFDMSIEINIVSNYVGNGTSDGPCIILIVDRLSEKYKN